MALGQALRLAAARLGRPAPLSIGFEITHLCNLACVYCDRHTPAPEEMSRDQILRVLGELHEMGMRHISLDGGEPLAHRYIDEVVDHLASMGGVRIFMNTNGILVPRKVATLRRLAKVKISLDGPPEAHDRMRGDKAHARAVRGALAAREAGIEVEFTCVVGSHNAEHIDALLDQVEELGLRIVFQPARPSLFLGGERDGSAFVPDATRLRAAFARIAHRKRQGAPVANRWSSLRHFGRYPDDTPLPCAAGWINATLDPEGNLFACGQASREHGGHSALRLGAREAFRRLTREPCAQCWCARVVEENLAWGGRIDQMLPMPPPGVTPAAERPRRRLPLRLIRGSRGGASGRAGGAPEARQGAAAGREWGPGRA